MYLDELSEKDWIIDIETDDLNASVIRLCIALNGVKDEYRIFTARAEFNEFLCSGVVRRIIGHNLISFDKPVLERLWSISWPSEITFVDSIVLSYLYNPRLEGGHSLEAYGKRVNLPKLEPPSFREGSLDELIPYCKRDCCITRAVTRALISKLTKRGFSDSSVQIEHDAAELIEIQKHVGFAFDTERARVLLERLRREQHELEGSIRFLFRDKLVEGKTYSLRRKSVYERHRATKPLVVVNEEAGTFTSYDSVPFNINSPIQRVERLLELGWVPEEFTKTGQPKVDEESLVKFAESSGIPEVQAIADYLVLQGRTTMISNWIDAATKYGDNRIHGSVFPCGANTRRMTHSAPNTANIPKAEASVKYGFECRDLWTASEGRLLVGIDAKGLEMRCFGHYLNNPEVANKYIHGDPHSDNAKALGVTRSQVKGIFYAFLYGAQDPKLGSIVGKDKKWGAWARETLMEVTPGLGDLVKIVQEEHKRGQIQCIDGGFVVSPSPHAALNYKLQSAGSIVMKRALKILVDDLQGLWGDHVQPVGNIHDEWQFDVSPKVAEIVGEMGIKAIAKAGVELGFRVPLDGDYKIGPTWAHTH